MTMIYLANIYFLYYGRQTSKQFALLPPRDTRNTRKVLNKSTLILKGHIAPNIPQIYSKFQENAYFWTANHLNEYCEYEY